MTVTDPQLVRLVPSGAVRRYVLEWRMAGSTEFVEYARFSSKRAAGIEARAIVRQLPYLSKSQVRVRDTAA